MFEALSEQLEAAWKKLRGQDKLTPSNIQEALKVVRRALIDADVNVQVVPKSPGRMGGSRYRGVPSCGDRRWWCRGI